MPLTNTASLFPESLLQSERESHAAECSRLQRIIDQLAQERALLEADRNRLRDVLARSEPAARQWQTLQSHLAGSLADDFADQLQVHLEDYQDDGSGCQAVCLDQETIAMDLREEELIPYEITASKELPDGTTARFLCRLDARSLRYEVEYVSSA